MTIQPRSFAAGWAKPVDTFQVGAISSEAINLFRHFGVTDPQPRQTRARRSAAAVAGVAQHPAQRGDLHHAVHAGVVAAESTVGASDDDRHIHRTIDKDVITTLDQTCTDCQP